MVFTVFSAHSLSKTVVFTRFWQSFAACLQDQNCKNIVSYSVFKICSKTGPFRGRRSWGQRIFSQMFWFLTIFGPAKYQKKSNTNRIKDFIENSSFFKVEIFKMQKRSEMMRRRRFLRPLSKNTLRGVGGAASAISSFWWGTTLLSGPMPALMSWQFIYYQRSIIGDSVSWGFLPRKEHRRLFLLRIPRRSSISHSPAPNFNFHR